MFNEWFDAFWNPTNAFEAGKRNASLVQGIKNYTLIPVVLAFLFGALVSAASSMLGGALAMVPGAGAILGIGVYAFALFPIAAFLLIAVFSLLSAAFFLAGAKLMGSNVKFTVLYYLTSLYLPAFYLILIGMVILLIAGLVLTPFLIGIPILMFGYALVYSVLFYYIYLYWVALKVATGLSNQKVVLAEAIGYFLLFIVLVVLIGFIVGAVIATTGIPIPANTGLPY